jgi:hypothetical protein
MAACINHPPVETDTTCARCGQPFCDACLVEFLGWRYCGPCRVQRLAEVQGPSLVTARYAGTGTVEIGRWLASGWQTVQGDLPAFMLATLLVAGVSLLTCGVGLGAMQCGLFMMAYRKMAYGSVSVETGFEGFRRFLNAFLTVLLIAVGGLLVRFIVDIPAYALTAIGIVTARGASEPNSILTILAQGYNYVTGAVLTALLSGATLFALPHVAARNADPIAALSASLAVFRRNILMFSLAGFLFHLLSLAGALACGLGALVTVPLVAAATAQAYADHFGIQDFDRTGYR